MPAEDSPAAIAAMVGSATERFAAVWAREAATIDWVIALGDRYEMFAAVSATVPFNLPVAHLHGGETTLGAIDDKYRHAITVMSRLHFTATEAYADRVRALVGQGAPVFCVGAPTLDDLEEQELYTTEELFDQFGTDFREPTILVTFHPETVASDRNAFFGRELCAALEIISSRYRIVITLPNADTAGSVLRQQFAELAATNSDVTTIESFGKRGYFSAMVHCVCLLGNTSSGIIEAASFLKFVVNLGQRQAGRARSANVLDAPIDRDSIVAAVAGVEARGFVYSGTNIYRNPQPAAPEIVRRLKQTAPR